MTNQRTLPIQAEHREFTVLVDGQVVARAHHLLSVSIAASVNKIASARLVYKDGDAASGAFPLLDEGLFECGKHIEIKANSKTDSPAMFAGIVVAQQLKIREHASAQLVITCKHAAVKMTLSKQNRYFEEVDTTAILNQLFDEYGIAPTIEVNDSITYAQLAQYQQSDWDYCLALANSAGLLVYTMGEQIVMRPPDISGDAVCNLEYGATLLSADLVTDARTQNQSIKGQRWDPVEQAVIEQIGQMKVDESPGNTSARSLSEALGTPPDVFSSYTQNDDELKIVSDARASFQALNRISGTLKSLGVEQALPSDIVNLGGLGKSFNGRALVTGVRHEMDTLMGWRTFYQVGGVDLQSTIASDGAMGLHIGKVVDIVDPNSEYRVKVKLPLLEDNSDGIWARVASLDAGPDRGLFVRPEINDEVIVGFTQNNLVGATILGMLHSSAQAPSEEPAEDNTIKTWLTKSGLALRFDDEQVATTLATPAGNMLMISDEEAGLILQDQHGNKYIMNAQGLTLESASDIKISAQGNIEMSAQGNIELAASSSFKAQGSAGSNLESPAITSISGSLVKIN